MRRVRIAFFVASIACALGAAAPACKTPAQVTLDIGITNAKCQKDVRSTAITVGVDPHETETNLANGYVTATTPECDVASGHVGTLVITPNDDMHASIIVTAAFGTGDSTACKPPKYEHCVVARRRFAFVEHQKLTLPIALDVSCVDVPCNEVSTCKNGQCVDSEVTPNGDAFGDPSTPVDAGDGNPQDGGSEGGGPGDSGGGDSASDGATDAADDGDATSAPTAPYCQPGPTLECPGAPCSPNEICCQPADGGTLAGCMLPAACSDASAAYCCADSNCTQALPAGQMCMSPPVPPGAPGYCFGAGSAAPPTTCDVDTNALKCAGQVCAVGVCCRNNTTHADSCQASCPVGSTQLCCSGSNCPSGMCLKSAGMGLGEPIVPPIHMIQPVGGSVGTCQ